MKRQAVFTTLATVIAIASAPALAKPGGGQGGGHGNAGAQSGATVGGGMGAGIGIGRGKDVSGSTGVNVGIDSGSTTRIRGTGEGRIRGSADAGVSAMGIGNTKLTGITDGMTVVDSSGATVGTVTDISTKGNSGNIRNVEVTLTNGDVITLSPRSLTVDGSVLTTTTVESNAKASNRRVNSQGAANANVNGLVNASPNSALAAAGVTTLTGLATGLTVENSGGTSIGTVNEILLNRSGAVVGIRVALAGGGTVFIPAGTLTMDGTTVVTSSTQF